MIRVPLPASSGIVGSADRAPPRLTLQERVPLLKSEPVLRLDVVSPQGQPPSFSSSRRLKRYAIPVLLVPVGGAQTSEFPVLGLCSVTLLASAIRLRVLQLPSGDPLTSSGAPVFLAMKRTPLRPGATREFHRNPAVCTDAHAAHPDQKVGVTVPVPLITATDFGYRPAVKAA